MIKLSEGLIFEVFCTKIDCVFNSECRKKEGKKEQGLCQGEHITIINEGCQDFRRESDEREEENAVPRETRLEKGGVNILEGNRPGDHQKKMHKMWSGKGFEPLNPPDPLNPHDPLDLEDPIRPFWE